jgi:hypothetical protein
MEQITPFSNLGPIPHLPRITTLRGQEGQYGGHANYTYSGALRSALLVQEMSNFICQNSDGRLSDVQRAIKEFIDISTADYLVKGNEAGETAAMSKSIYVLLRINKLGHLALLWHTDGQLYCPEKSGDVNSFYCTTLLGNPTKVNRVPANGKGTATYYPDAATRHILDTGPLQTVELGDIIRFTFAQPDSPLHAAGNTDKDRIFLLIAYGSSNEIRSLPFSYSN